MRHCWVIYIGHKYGFYMGGRDPDNHDQGVLVARGLASKKAKFFETPNATGRVNLFFGRWRFACFDTPDGGIGMFSSAKKRFLSRARAKEKCESRR